MDKIIKKDYRDYVIKEGKLIADFEGLYKDIEDPWNQSRSDHQLDSRRLLAINWCKTLRNKFGSNRVIELGCGFGHMTEQLRHLDFSAVGIDISQTAIDKARVINPSSVFYKSALNNFKLLSDLDADIFLMPELTWYILDELDAFIDNLKHYSWSRERPVFLIHILTTYPCGVQEYGKDKFTNLKEILAYFDMKYLEYGTLYMPKEDNPDAQGTYFIAEV